MINLNIEKLKQYINDGYVSARRHETDVDLTIYNYTAQTQYNNFWNEITMQCRGLILDSNYNIISKPFPKFFNYQELESKGIEVPKNMNFVVQDKIDGSLGISYFLHNDNIPFICTRGSFHSEQADKANMLLRTKYLNDAKKMKRDITYLFEIVYPENRIVVNYGDSEELYLLAMIETDTGRELELSNDLSFPKPKIYNCKDYKNITQLFDGANREGFVIKFDNGFRMKIKYEEYVRLHRILTNLSEKSVYEYMMSNIDNNINDFLKNVPDEYYDTIKNWHKKYNDQFATVKAQCEVFIKDLNNLSTRKEKALRINEKYQKYNFILFAMLDNDPNKTHRNIWNFILKGKNEET